MALPPGFYCERVLPGLWGEPLNALSNLAFLGAAWHAGVRLAPRHPARAAAVRWLAGLLMAVGLASLAFHTIADEFTQVLDVLFIGVFNLSYLALFTGRVLNWRNSASGLALIAFVVADQTRAALVPARTLHGSAMYLLPLAVLLGLAAACRQRDRRAARRLVQAALLFCLSLAARTADLPLCAAWPAGLHWLWHLLNAWVLWRLIQAFAQAGRAGGLEEDAA